MKASVITEFGGPEVLQVREVPLPEPGSGQVAIRVAYAGVNYAETMARRGGLHSGEPPFVPGLEVSGHIQSLGAGVKGLRVGQPVAALTGSGGYAEVALAYAAFTFPLDEAGAPLDLAVNLRIRWLFPLSRKARESRIMLGFILYGKTEMRVFCSKTIVNFHAILEK
jgi:NADPH2:quinone reductase